MEHANPYVAWYIDPKNSSMFEVDRIIKILYFSLRLYDRASYIMTSGKHKIAKCSTANFSTTSKSNLIIPSKPKSSIQEYSSETISAILELYKSSQTHGEIAQNFKIPKFSLTTILHRQARQPKQSLQPTKQPGRLLKLDARAKRAIICHSEKFSHDNLHTLSNPSKSGLALVEPQYGIT